MTLEQRKEKAIKNYTEAAQAAGVFDSFVIRCIEEFKDTPPQAEKKSWISKLGL